MSKLFSRRDMAAQMASRILSPGVLDEGLRSGLFLSGMRRIGKTTFLLNDLIPELEQRQAIVIYVDLWSDLATSPASLVHDAIKRTLAELASPASGLLKRLKNLRAADLTVLGFKFGFKLEAVGEQGGPTLAQVLTEVVDQAKTDVVLIVDEVQQAMSSEEGQNLLLALKAARDAINARPDAPGHFIFIGTGSHRALVQELTSRRTQAFAGATSVAYPLLGEDYVEHLLNRLGAEGVKRLPSAAVAWEAFKTLGHRPEEMLKALRVTQQQVSSLTQTGRAGDADPDKILPVVAATLRATAADIELARLDEMGPLAKAVFERIAADSAGSKGVFSGEAAQAYAKAIGRDVKVEEVQPVVNALLAANLVIRQAHGVYAVADPQVQQMWQEKRALEARS
ncbi:MAG: ATP-binding protein [Vitreoscilla sp.]|nr:ATP-binding protein [Vitreoscilla sp.]